MNSPRLSAQAVSPQAKRHIGQILISQGILTEDQLRIALLEQLKTHQPVGKLLVNLGFVSEATLRDALSEKLGLQSVDLTQIVVDSMALKLVPREFSKRHTVFPVALDREARKLIIAIADTNNIVALDQVRAQLRGEFALEMRLAGEGEIGRAIDQYYGHDFSIDGILHEIETGEIDYQSLQVSGDAYSQPVVRLISALLADAVERGASDIHFEPEQSFLRIRYRIDGVLRQIRSLHKTYWPAMAVRIKVMAKMNIAETRAPQDGRISATMSGRVVDFRVASLPTSHGENLVLRVLERQDHDALLDPEPHQLRRHQRDDARGSGRIPDDADPPDFGGRGSEARFRERHPRHDAPGPRRHPGRRDPRPGDRRDGVPRRDDWPPGVHDAAHQLRGGRLPAAARHRHRARHPGGQHHRHPGAAPGEEAVPH